MASPTVTIEHFEAALRGLDVVLKAVRFYPPGHPALKQAVARTLLKFQGLLRGRESIVFSIHQSGFLLDETPLGARNQVLENLALYLFSRHVRTLMLLPDLTARDLLVFAQCLVLEPTEIQQRGGIQELLSRNAVATLWLNEIDLSRALARKKAIEAPTQAGPWDQTGPADATSSATSNPASSAASDTTSSAGSNTASGGASETSPDAAAEPKMEGRDPLYEAFDLEKILQELERTKSDQHFQSLARNIEPLVLLNLNPAGGHLVLRALTLLSRFTDRQVAQLRRQVARDVLLQLAREEVIEFLLLVFCQKEHPPKAREQLFALVGCFRGRIEKYLMEHLAEETDAQSRKILGGALIRLGASASPIVIEYLRDPRWFVVRNAIGILGEIRDQKATGYLAPLLGHKDLRVRRETIRALTKIGGQSAEATLLKILKNEDPEMRRQAILSLGALQCATALPALLELASRSDRKGVFRKEKIEAVKALGQIGSSEAVPKLKTLLKRRFFWFAPTDSELRAEAALALGRIGSPEARNLLRKAIKDRSEAVARAARLALNRIEKTPSHAS